MADKDLVNLIQTVASSGPRGAAYLQQGQATDADDLHGVVNQSFGAGFDPLNSQNFPSWLPDVPAEATDQNLDSDNPARPGGALEVLSVALVKGAAGGQVPCGVRRYAVRGRIL